jgi:hypothetical protein
MIPALTRKRTNDFGFWILDFGLSPGIGISSEPWQPCPDEKRVPMSGRHICRSAINPKSKIQNPK